MSLADWLAQFSDSVLHSLVIGVFMPILSLFYYLLSPRILRSYSDRVAIVNLGISLVASLLLLGYVYQAKPYTLPLTWLHLPASLAGWETAFTFRLRIDKLASLMLVLVNVIALLVHIFSLSYIKRHPHYDRYWAYLGFFCFAMYGIVLSHNLLLTFFFWEWVGLSSYLLIGFSHSRIEASKASQKAFLINRIGDVGFLLAILFLFSQFRTWDLSELSAHFSNTQILDGYWQFSHPSLAFQLPPYWIHLLGYMLVAAALGKSAQFPLQVWLPDAMTGPTPASALIHAATMVAAGIYLLARVYVLLSAQVLETLAYIGAATALMAAMAALNQRDIKRVLAYSTLSQLGYMTLALGVGAYGMALFHLFTHAFFKCALFLAAGAIIHEMEHLMHTSSKKLSSTDSPLPAQDLQLMGGLAKYMPQTQWAYLFAMLSLAGLPLFSGFLSKDGILLAVSNWAYEHSSPLAWMVTLSAFLSAFLTALYMARHGLKIFAGNNRFMEKTGETKRKPHEAPLLMRIPLVILAFASLGILFSLNPLDGAHSWLLTALPQPEYAVPASLALNTYADPHFHLLVPLLSTVLSLGGLLLGYRYFHPRFSKNPRFLFPKWMQNLSFHHFYQDKAYEAIGKGALLFSSYMALIDKKLVDGVVNLVGNSVVNGKTHLPSVSRFAAAWDRYIIDGLVNGLAAALWFMGKRLRRWQDGQVQHYLLSVLTLLVLLGTLLFFYLT